MSGYSLWNKREAVRGGYSGRAAIEEGNSAQSRLIHLVAGLEEDLVMPPAGSRLTPEEIGILRAWIDQGVGCATGGRAFSFFSGPKLSLFNSRSQEGHPA